MIDESTSTFFGVYYYTNTAEVDISIYSTINGYEVTMNLPASMMLPYTAFIALYPPGGTSIIGSVQVSKSYNGEPFSSFTYFSGSTEKRSDMLKSLNTNLPLVIEHTRAILFENGYTLKDVGLNDFKICSSHFWDEGVITMYPSCLKGGRKTYTCLFCGGKENREHPAHRRTRLGRADCSDQTKLYGRGQAAFHLYGLQFHQGRADPRSGAYLGT